ncbi:MAG: DUF86 domain-containing protein [Anaerolineae bacterium]|nr:DUF86 domain-containing protein [Anaerolineae bacterium]
MVDAAKIAELVAFLRDYQNTLRSVGDQSLDRYMADRDSIDLGRFRLHMCLQASIDIAEHIVASEGIAVKSAQDAVSALNRLGVIPDDFVDTLSDMVGMRNRLVHGYLRIRDQQVYGVIKNYLGDFDRFIEYILAYVNRQNQLLE